MKSLTSRRCSPLSIAGLCMAVFAVVGFVGCLKSPNPDKLRCKTKDGCPANYYCGEDSRCHKGAPTSGTGGTTSPTDGGRGDGSTDGAGTGGIIGDGSVITRRDGAVGGDAGVDAPIGTGGGQTGDSCTAGTECPTGFCVDGVCCENECKGSCMACAELLTGKASGTCAAVATGKKDPRDACKDETATNQCGNDGYCDGAGACRKVGTDHVCATASCNKSVFTPTSTCDGKGACKVVAPVECGEAPCDMVDGCRSSCATDADCAAGLSYCNVATKRCAAKKIDGDTCGGAVECSSGFCVDGVCCNKACTEKCMACSNALTTVKSGICGAVKVGTDPRDSCAVDATNECGLDGTCDGAGACRMNGTDTVCKAAACAAGAFTPAATCDGKGKCGAPVPQSCGAFTCDTYTGCQKACALDTDCTGKSYCDAVTKSCSAQKDNGKSCTVGKECVSGNCVDGMCCNTACAGACNACKKEHTNGTDGICASVVAGKDPYNSCADQTATNPCGNTGSCDGAGACQKVDKTKSCGTASCSGATFTPASMCDGLGTCKAGSPTNCGDYQCSITTGCLTTCASNADCSTATYCDTSLAKPVCTAKKKPGESCGGTDGSKCSTGNCVDGVCCSTASCQSCYACNLNGAGTCSTVPAGTADPRGVCKASGTPCGQDGMCDGSGACRYPATGTKCADTTCTGSSKTSSTCTTSHTCSSSTTACPNLFVCNAAKTDCLATCASKSDCTGTNQCSAGMCVLCTPKARDCTSSADNDCNGTPDNLETAYCACTVGSVQPCQTHPGYDGKGICKAGSQTCVASSDKTTSSWGACSGSVGPGTETCDSGLLDENCNGTANENCQCVNGTNVPCGTCGGTALCTNGVLGACSKQTSIFYRDLDGDTYGDPNTTQALCAAQAGWVARTGDCDDTNASLRYGTTVCSGVVRRGCTSAGAASDYPCPQGCLNGICRTDGTVGVPGKVSCGEAGYTRAECSKAEGCTMPMSASGDGTCGGVNDISIYCDGPNDCSAGWLCCRYTMGYSHTYSCFEGSCPPDLDSRRYYKQVCDYQAASCPTGTTCTLQTSLPSLCL